MSSQNVEQNTILKYLTFSLEVWGINYITKEIIKKARDNSVQAAMPMKKLLFDLAILEIVEFQYSVTELGIDIADDLEFLDEFLLAYLSEANCPLLQTADPNCHSLDFKSSRILLITVGWLMAKTMFFNKIKTKMIDKKFSALYIQNKSFGKKNNDKQNTLDTAQKNVSRKGYDEIQTSTQNIERLYKRLTQSQFRVQCLENKKLQIITKLNKQLAQYNKKHETNIKIDHLLNEDNNRSEQFMEQEQFLQFILKQSNNGMKNQQYFWIWMQRKVIQTQLQYIKNQYQLYQDVQPIKTKLEGRMNPLYLSTYHKQYTNAEKLLNDVNIKFAQQIQPYLDNKPVKNQAALRKQIIHETNKILNEWDKKMVQQLGNPCFLKFQVMKYCQKKGFGLRPRKSKLKAQKEENNLNKKQLDSKLRQQIQDFINNIDQLKFI